jgi:hypothetical protein
MGLGGRLVGYTDELDMRLVDTLQNSRPDLHQVGRPYVINMVLDRGEIIG